jgi:hypothetical protein
MIDVVGHYTGNSCCECISLNDQLTDEYKSCKPDPLYGQPQTRSIRKKDAPYVLYMIGTIMLACLLLM